MIETVAGLTDLQIKFFTALGQILVAVAVGTIAWRQWRTAQQQAETARKKLRLDLFEHRIQTFDRIQELLEMNLSGHVSEKASQELWDLAGASGRVRWLFGPRIQQRFEEEVLGSLNAATRADQAVDRAQSLDELKVASKSRERANEELGKALRSVPDIFASSLTLLD